MSTMTRYTGRFPPPPSYYRWACEPIKPRHIVHRPSRALGPPLQARIDLTQSNQSPRLLPRLRTSLPGRPLSHLIFSGSGQETPCAPGHRVWVLGRRAWQGYVLLVRHRWGHAAATMQAVIPFAALPALANSVIKSL